MSSWVTGNFSEGAAAADKNAKLECLAPLFCWRFSERVGFGERGRRLFRSSRSELKVPAKQFSLKVLRHAASETTLKRMLLPSKSGEGYRLHLCGTFMHIHILKTLRDPR